VKHTNISRPLPHSLEAEEYLLSSCLLDGADVISRCVDARIRPESFYDAKHGIIFERLLDLYNRQAPIDVSIVAEELKTARQLDQIGGYPFLTQVSSRIPTTAQAGYFIDKVREQSLLRDIIRSANGTLEDCYNFSGGIDEFAQRVATRIAAVVSPDAIAPGSAVASWTNRRAGCGRVIPESQTVLWLADTSLFTRGNIGVVTALQKTGKSAAVGGMLGALIGGANVRGDTLGFRGSNEDRHAVLHIDTEQSPADHEALVGTALRRAGLDSLPPWLYSFSAKGVSPEEMRRMIARLLREVQKAHGGVLAVLIDGVGDLCFDLNDAREVGELVTELESIAAGFNCSAIGVLHLNPSPAGQLTKSRGHLGSHLERKCETDLRLVKDGDGITTMFTASARHSPIIEADGPRFSWSVQDGMHRLLSGSNRQDKESAEKEYLRELAGDCFAGTPTPRMRWCELVAAVEKTAKCKERTAQEKVARMKKMGVVIQVPPRLLQLAS
jgi:hypothetical protein